jgi:hypothetical protein
MTQDIKCPRCGTLFGKEYEGDGWTLLTIKYRDLFRSFVSGTVFGPCRGCGDTVKWESHKVDAK